MLTIIVILGIWLVLSLPMSVVLGVSLRGNAQPELMGMDGDVAVFRRPDGAVERMPLGERTSR
jgi:hypothetical protein